jgi:hypothetical protein
LPNSKKRLPYIPQGSFQASLTCHRGAVPDMAGCILGSWAECTMESHRQFATRLPGFSIQIASSDGRTEQPNRFKQKLTGMKREYSRHCVCDYHRSQIPVAIPGDQ